MMEFAVDNINLLMFLPLFICFVVGFNGLLTNKVDTKTLSLMSIVSSLICLILSAFSLISVYSTNLSFSSGFYWLSVDGVSFYFGTLLDKVSVVFVQFVAVLNFIFQLFMYYKLRDKQGFSKLLLLFNLFTFGLVGVFLSQNLFQTYLFCEIVGVVSYLLVSFDFNNREESKAGIKLFIYNRLGDLALLFCVLSVLYYSVFYNDLNGVMALAYSEMSSIAATISSLFSNVFYIVFCSLLFFAIVMKFVQAFVYLVFEKFSFREFFQIILLQNSFICLIGVYLFLRLQPFFYMLSQNWVWLILALFVFILILSFLICLIRPFCKICYGVEKYIFEMVLTFVMLFLRALSYLANNMQKGNFQSYLIYSFIGLIFIFIFVFVFYLTLVK